MVHCTIACQELLRCTKTLAGRHVIDLPTTGRKGPSISSTHTKQDHFRYVVGSRSRHHALGAHSRKFRCTRCGRQGERQPSNSEKTGASDVPVPMMLSLLLGWQPFPALLYLSHVRRMISLVGATDVSKRRGDHAMTTKRIAEVGNGLTKGLSGLRSCSPVA